MQTKCSNFEMFAKKSCKARFIIFQVNECKDDQNLNLYFNQQAIDLFVNATKNKCNQKQNEYFVVKYERLYFEMKTYVFSKHAISNILTNIWKMTLSLNRLLSFQCY